MPPIPKNLYVKKAQDEARVFRSIITNERNFANEFENYVKATGTRPTQSNWNNFLSRYKEETKGLRNENFHDYMKLKGMTHHLSETQIIERNRENQGLNAYGLMSNLVPMATSLGAIFGGNYLLNRGYGNGGVGFGIPNFDGVNKLGEMKTTAYRQDSLSGENSHYETHPPHHLGSDLAPELNLIDKRTQQIKDMEEGIERIASGGSTGSEGAYYSDTDPYIAGSMEQPILGSANVPMRLPDSEVYGDRQQLADLYGAENVDKILKMGIL